MNAPFLPFLLCSYWIRALNSTEKRSTFFSSKKMGGGGSEEKGGQKNVTLKGEEGGRMGRENIVMHRVHGQVGRFSPILNGLS